MKKSTLALAVTVAALAQQAGAAGFLEDSKASVSSRTLYFNNDLREGRRAPDQRETATGLKFDYTSGFTQGTVGFGLDAQAVMGLHLGGGIQHHTVNTANTVVPTDTDGSSVSDWSRVGANAKMRFSKTELKVGNALAPNLPILVANDGRLLPQAFEGGILTSKDLDNVTFTAGQLNKSIGRASSNWTDLSVAGATQTADQFRFAGADWKVTKDLTLQYYYANLEDFYKQHFLGLVHVYPISDNQSFKTDLRYFNSSSDGKNSEAAAGYRFNNNGGYASHAGEVDNQTWSAMFTYALGGHSFMVGHQQVGDSGGMVFLGQGNVVDGRGRPEGNGGSSFYLFTDSMINGFNRAGENTTFGQYSYDFAKVGVPGLKAAIAYLSGDDIRDVNRNLGTHSEWERDMRVDYVIQSGVLKGFGTTVRHGTFRGDVATTADTDQTRILFNYTYNFM
ncbi:MULTISPECIES: OprD family outer membrane porin [Pseudomonas syringae group]|uniref:Outer membrane porin, OprD family n=3 Tax=Pseudomonas syringae group genomosp. 3 TaxID=251701 RepID=Q87UH9_PSESM|nr:MULTISPECIES: OprD family outer membrane porin [Pseudomonas syringae group]KPC10501.1 Outer membrane porin [Pseudomonas amygdali pv. lachrymans]AAO58744.1 outer membrane porin, OprD family [Pseudomonas syringae pv. tomato str. DC3000]KKI24971.1 porin [Pseudomonas syringae pv. persicae]KPB92747.1 Outer membrane porin [Pseudomonas syringae pv. maculicola]KPC06740.1 Outer membrane porin [Pseudomonas syringae pv. maculicola]